MLRAASEACSVFTLLNLVAASARTELNASCPSNLETQGMILKFLLPKQGSRVFGTHVPVQVQLDGSEACRVLQQRRCSVVVSDPEAGQGRAELMLPVADVLSEGGARVDGALPLFYEGQPRCAAGSKDGRSLCYVPTLLSGSRRLSASVRCPSHVDGHDDIAYSDSMAKDAYVDFYAVQQQPDLSDDAMARLQFYRPGSDLGSTALVVDWDVGCEEQAVRFCESQGFSDHAARPCVDMVTEAIRTRKDERYHAYVSALHGALVEGGVDLADLEGACYSCPTKLKLMKDLVSQQHVGRVCEIGFNAGHSALLWLLYGGGGAHTTVLAFDLAEHAYTHLAVNWLLKRFGPRLEVVMGSSVLTVPAYTEMHPDVKCDLIFVDGGHYGDVPLADLESMYHLANTTRHTVLVDDSNTPDIIAAVKVLESRGRFTVGDTLHSHFVPVFHETAQNDSRGWIVFYNFDAMSDLLVGHYVLQD